MTAPVFVDTNVFVYRYDASEPEKQLRARDWLQFLWPQRSGRLSHQVLHELYVTLTRKLRPGIPAPDARRIVRDLALWQPVATELTTIERAWRLEERHRLSWWDALIVAAAQAGDCRVLLTEDLQHGQIFGSLQVVNPFEAWDRTPEEVLATESA